MNHNFKRRIGFSTSLKSVLIVALLISVFIPLTIILLGPSDTDIAEFKFKNLKLAGYSVAIFIGILLLRPLEYKTYQIQNKKWYLYNEILYLGIGIIGVITLCYFYHELVISESLLLNIDNWTSFIWKFGLPFAPILVPIWFYMRNRLGVIEIENANTSKDKEIEIVGSNKSENLNINFKDFILAKAQQNYVQIYYYSEGIIVQKMIRISLTKLISQIPDAVQVHRSYIANIDYMKSVKGNSRKRIMTFNIKLDPIPISKKYYDALKIHSSYSSL